MSSNNSSSSPVAENDATNKPSEKDKEESGGEMKKSTSSSGKKSATPGIVRKAKERVYSKMGKRTTLTRNPRVDYISVKVDDIKARKKKVSVLADHVKSHLKKALEASVELQSEMLEAWKAELGQREWNEQTGDYERVFATEEHDLVADLNVAYEKFATGTQLAMKHYLEHIEEMTRKPLMTSSVDEELRLDNLMRTKEKYKVARTEYSDATIDSQKDPSSTKLQQKVEEKKLIFEQMSDALAEDAFQFESLYRKELPERIQTHLNAQMSIVRSLFQGLKELYPFTQTMSLDWETLQPRSVRDARLASLRDDLGRESADMQDLEKLNLSGKGDEGDNGDAMDESNDHGHSGGEGSGSKHEDLEQVNL